MKILKFYNFPDFGWKDTGGIKVSSCHNWKGTRGRTKTCHCNRTTEESLEERQTKSHQTETEALPRGQPGLWRVSEEQEPLQKNLEEEPRQETAKKFFWQKKAQISILSSIQVVFL